MTENQVLSALGGFISVLLMVNAYFTRETLLRVVQIEVKMGENSTKQVYNEAQIIENKKDIESLKFKVHRTQYESTQLMEYLKSKEL